MIYRDVLKRLADIIFSIFLIVVASPILLASAVLVRVTSEGPVFFTQKRIGRHGRVFVIYKLRTMRHGNASPVTQTRIGDPDVTFIGNILRRSKVDELPQIFNVLSGDMSLVGPRPCLVRTLETMPEWAKDRFSLRPGMTGLAQINGNIALSWEERWRHDVEYVRRCSAVLDLYIICKTVLVVIFGETRFRKFK